MRSMHKGIFQKEGSGSPQIGLPHIQRWVISFICFFVFDREFYSTNTTYMRCLSKISSYKCFFKKAHPGTGWDLHNSANVWQAWVGFCSPASCLTEKQLINAINVWWDIMKRTVWSATNRATVCNMNVMFVKEVLLGRVVWKPTLSTKEANAQSRQGNCSQSSAVLLAERLVPNWQIKFLIVDNL